MAKIGRYELLEEIGRGGMGVVQKAFDPLVGRELAIKVMSESFSTQPNFRDRFFQEARNAGKLNHPNIVTVYDAGEENGRPYLVMEFLEGHDLRDEIDRTLQMTLERRLEVMRSICQALSHAHERYVVHRDVKPSNIFLTSSGEVKLLDFGLARTISAITRSTLVMGTPNYMSPEQYRREADHRSDIFSTGAVFYELLTGKMAFPGDPVKAMNKILESEPEPVEAANPLMPLGLSSLVTRALQKNPDDRYQSVEEMSRQIEEIRRSLDPAKPPLQEEALAAVARLRELIQREDHLLQKDGTDGLADVLELMPGIDPEEMQTASLSRAGLPEDYLGLAEVGIRASRNCERLSVLAAKRKQLSPLLEDAKALEAQQEFERAVETLEDLLKEDPGHPIAVSRRRELVGRIEEERARQERARRAEELFQEADTRYSSGDWPGSRALLETVLELQPENSQAISLNRHVEAKIRKQKERENHIQELFKEAADFDQEGSEDKSLERLQQILELAPDHTLALDRVQTINDRRRKRLRAQGLMETAAARMESQDFDATLQCVDEILSFDPDNASAKTLEKEVQLKLKEEADREKKRRRAAKSIAQARKSLTAEDLDRARKQIETARSVAPELKEITELSQMIDRAEEERLHRDRFASLLARSQQALSVQDLDGASAQVREAVRMEPANEEATALQATIERALTARGKQLRIDTLIVESEQCLIQEDFGTATLRARSVLKLQSENSEARSLLERISRAQKEKQIHDEIETLFRQSSVAQARQDFAEALRLVREVQRLDPGNVDARERIRQIQQERLQRQWRNWTQMAGSKRSYRLAAWIVLPLVLLVAALGVFSSLRVFIPLTPDEQYGPTVQEAMSSGSYQEAGKVLDLWLGVEPQSQQAKNLKVANDRLLEHLQHFDAAVEDHDYESAEEALASMQALNRTNPNAFTRQRTRIQSVFSPDFQDDFLGSASV